MIKTKFWSDGWVRGLDKLTRYLFLYLLSNEHSRVCGIYELPKDVMAFETGFELDELRERIVKLEPKVYYIEGWVVLSNFIKNQNQRSPKILAGITAQLSEIPPNIVEKIKGIYTLSHLNLKYKDNLKGYSHTLSEKEKRKEETENPEDEEIRGKIEKLASRMKI